MLRFFLNVIANVLGYGLIAFILDTGSQGPSNSSAPFDYAKSCGLRNCPSTPLPSSQSNPTRQSFYIYYVCLLCLCGASVLITFFFIDNIKENSDYEEIDKPTVCTWRDVTDLYCCNHKLWASCWTYIELNVTRLRQKTPNRGLQPG